MRHIFSFEAFAVVLGNKAGVEFTTHELGVGQEGRLKRNVARHAADHKAVERLAHTANSVQPVFAVHDELSDH